MSEQVIKTLNEFLQGQYMGIHAYEHHIQKLDDEHVKQEFQRIQQEHKIHALKVAKRIQNLGGTPVTNEGIVGSVTGYMSKFKIPDETNGIIESAITGESDYGIGISEDIVRGDLDNESMKLIQEILDKDREHVEFLRKLVH